MRLDFEELERSLGHHFSDRALLKRALTHKSVGSDRREPSERPPDNEQLEFLGDSILGFIASEYLLEHFPSFPEGRLSKLKAHLVSKAHLAKIAEELHLGAYLHLGRGEELSGGRSKKALVANALEAIIAAIYLDGGFEAARQFVRRTILASTEIGMLEDTSSDYKSRLQEHAQAHRLPLPRYITVRESGPEHAKVFIVEARIGADIVARGEGTSKKSAGQDAARRILDQLEKEKSLTAEPA
jgi:ribonuclease-3